MRKQGGLEILGFGETFKVTHRFFNCTGLVGVLCSAPNRLVVQRSTVYLGAKLLEHRVCEYSIWEIVAVFGSGYTSFNFMPTLMKCKKFSGSISFLILDIVRILNFSLVMKSKCLVCKT